ncbi:hypothetical protein D3C73_1056420 [compost metagenome]
MMIDVVEKSFNVAFNEPFRSCKFLFDLHKRGVAASVWPEAMRKTGECTLIDALQHHANYFLHQFVIERWDTKRPHFSVCFPNVYPSCGIWLVRMIPHTVDELGDTFHSHAINGLSIRAFGHVTRFCVDVLVGHQIKFRVVQIPI